MDRQFRLFGKISVLDIILVAALVVFIALAAQFSAPQSAAAKPGDKAITYVVELDKKPKDFADKVHKGDTLIDSLKGYEIGVITDVRVEPYRDEASNEATDKIMRPEIDGLYSIYITVDAQAQVTDRETLIGQYDVMVGKNVYVKTRNFAAGGYIVKLDGVRG